MEKNFWLDKKVLVSGSEGFVGTALVKALKDRKAIVTGFDLKNGQDVRKITDVRDALDLKPDIVFHLAAETQVVKAKGDIINTYSTNIAGTLNIVKACLEANVPVVIASTDKVYGSSRRPVIEDSELVFGNGVYEDSKCYMDYMVRDICEKSNLQAVLTRSANIYGFGDGNDARLVPGLINHILKNKPFSLRSNGKQVRTYVYVDDVVAAYMLLGESFLNRGVKSGEVFNIASYEDVLSVVQVCNLAGVEVEVVKSRDNKELDKQVVYADKLRALGWCPRMNMADFFESVWERKEHEPKKKDQ